LAKQKLTGKIAIETVLGILLGVILFFSAIFFSTDNVLIFLHIPSFLMVAGGTLAATMISFRGRYVLAAFRELAGIFLPQDISPKTLYRHVESIMSWARILKSKGMIGLESEMNQTYTKDPFLKYAGEMLLTGYRGDELRKMLTNFTETTYERNMMQSHILRTMASFAPGFGMLGTVIGLIIMLDNLGSDPTELGKGLAFALITTLYGVFLAQFILKPAAEKVRQKQEILRFRNLLVTEGFVLLGENKDSMLIQDMLNSFLDPSLHFSILKERRKARKQDT
jgi:chemotaxis protein MotA